jgi:hypothetical protein
MGGRVAIRGRTRDHLTMRFFVVEPEASGRPAGRQPATGEPACSFDTWLGDDVVRAHPLLLVTARVKDALSALKGRTGFSPVRAHASRSAFFERHDPDRGLPEFWSLEVDGKPGIDDLGIGRDGSVIASARLVETLNRFSLKHATLSQYEPLVTEDSRRSPLLTR